MIAIVIIVILILIIIYLITTGPGIFNELVNGFYEADASFCKEADLDTFCIYFDDDISLNNSRPCYILAKRGNDIVINEPCSVKLNLKWSTMLDSTEKHFSVEFRDLSDEITDVFPQNQTMKYYPQIGKIVMYDSDTITYVGYKNSMNTEMKTVTRDQDSE